MRVIKWGRIAALGVCLTAGFGLGQTKAAHKPIGDGYGDAYYPPCSMTRSGADEGCKILKTPRHKRGHRRSKGR